MDGDFTIDLGTDQLPAGWEVRKDEYQSGPVYRLKPYGSEVPHVEIRQWEVDEATGQMTYLVTGVRPSNMAGVSGKGDVSETFTMLENAVAFACGLVEGFADRYSA